MKSKEYLAVKNLIHNAAGLSREELRAMVRLAVVETINEVVREEAGRAVLLKVIAKEALKRQELTGWTLRERIAELLVRQVKLTVEQPRP